MIAAKQNGPDLDRCANEQVQIIGHIQPHGLLFALSEPDLLVKQLSSNIAALLGMSPDSVLDRSFEAVLGGQQFRAFRAQLLSGQQHCAGLLRLPIRDGVLEMEYIAYSQDGVRIVELEPSQAAPSPNALDLDDHILLPLSRMRAASDIRELARVTANEVRRLSGFARVMIYRFDKEWNGEVIAESVDPSPVSYFGLRFPAADFPSQVRQLFLLNAIRAIVDVDATPAPIVPEICPLTGRALDLTCSVLRSASPIHLEYLRNMGVQSSLTLSILVEGRLWGMIACHDDKAHPLARSTRSVCKFLAEALAAQVALRTDNIARESGLTARAKLDQVAAGIMASESLVEAARSQSTRLLDLFHADGLVSCIEGLVTSQGATVQAELLYPVVGELRNLASRGVASCDELGQRDPDLAAYASVVSGALYIGLARTGSTKASGDFLLFLRRELVETISWAGNPNKSGTADEHHRLHPRKSFEAWQETMHGISLPWTETELESGLMLREQMLKLGDILDSKRAQQVLCESEERFRTMADGSPSMMWVTDAAGEVEFINRAFSEFSGVTAEEPQRGKLLMLFHPDDALQYAATIDREVREHAPFSVEGRFRRADGEWRMVGTSARPRFSTSGEFLGHVGISADITERRRFREQLLQAQKLEAVGQLAAGIAHEINTPMQYIGDNVRFLQDTFAELVALQVGYARLLAAVRRMEVTPQILQEISAMVEKADVEYLLEEIPKAIEQTLEGVSRVSTLVKAMKEFSHPGTGEKVPLNLNHAIESSVTVSRNEWKYVADMKMVLDPTLPLVSGLPGEFNQVVVNVIVNAAHAIADAAASGGPKRGLITIRTRSLPGWVEVRIRDTGGGIPEKVRQRIFDPFFTTREIGKGTGQGLAIARSVVVDKHQGTIDFETEEGHGTSFIIRLPRAAV